MSGACGQTESPGAAGGGDIPLHEPQDAEAEPPQASADDFGADGGHHSPRYGSRQ